MMTIAYEKLQPMDLVLTSGRGPWTRLVRWITAGRKARRNKDVATHCGPIVMIGKQPWVLMAEMLAKGLDLNSLKDYTESKCKYIVAVRRPKLTIPAIELQERVFEDLVETLGYDYRGLIEFVNHRVRDNPDRAYCSEYYYLITRGHMAHWYPERFKQKVSPHDLQLIEGFTNVPWNR